MRKQELEKINSTKGVQSRVSFNNMMIKEQIIDNKELITTGSSLLQSPRMNALTFKKKECSC